SRDLGSPPSMFRPCYSVRSHRVDPVEHLYVREFPTAAWETPIHVQILLQCKKTLVGPCRTAACEGIYHSLQWPWEPAIHVQTLLQ
ncbi:hypothetical protein NDU88_006573, partial [Pleurodeles waltl]